MQLPEVNEVAAKEEAKKQRIIAIEEHENLVQRLARITYPIRTMSAELCEKRTGETGMRATYWKDAENEFTEARKEYFNLGKYARVVQVLDGSPADRAGIKVGDEMVAINGDRSPEDETQVMEWVVKHFTPDKHVHDAHDEGGESDDNWAEKADAGKPELAVPKRDAKDVVSLRMKRGDEERDVEIAPQLSCDYPIVLRKEDKVNAFADGTKMYMTAGMMRFAQNDNELALVIGHEMAHNTMLHSRKKQASEMVGIVIGALIGAAIGVDLSGVGGDIGRQAFSQELEAEADYVGLYYTARAGFDISKAAHFWRRMAANHPGAIHLSGSTHPSTAKRFLALEKARDEIMEKKKSGETLAPNPQKTPTLQPSQDSSTSPAS